MTAYIIDTETTDSDPKTAEVIELAYAPLLKDFEYGPAEIFRFKPSHPSKWGALATHHILPLDLEGHPASSFLTFPKRHFAVYAYTGLCLR